MPQAFAKCAAVAGAAPLPYPPTPIPQAQPSTWPWLRWQVPWRRIKESQLQLDRNRVLLTLMPEADARYFGGPLSRAIECPHRAGLSLAHTTIEEQRKKFAAKGAEPLLPI